MICPNEGQLKGQALSLGEATVGIRCACRTGDPLLFLPDMDTYILDENGNPIREINLLKWSKEMDTPARTVGREKVGDSEISTVFLGIDHGFGETEVPILWETMVFGGRMDTHTERCSGTREQAEAMHAAVVAKVKERANDEEGDDDRGIVE
jgi:hypothetical protein